jgi:hypothetical protein
MPGEFELAHAIADPATTAGFGLDPQFAKTVAVLISTCRLAGYDFRISQGLRPPATQAKYYCQWDQHTPAKVDVQVQKLKDKGAPWIAALLASYRNIPRSPKWLTNALPGAGWHQWGLAVDAYCYRDGKMVTNGSDKAYKYYAEAATKLGLTAGYYFTSQDSGHVQGPSQAGASNVYTWSQIDAVMKERFGDKLEVALATTSVESLEAAMAAGPAAVKTFYKDDPVLIASRVSPAQLYQIPAGTGADVRQMAQGYNAVGGLVDTLSAALKIDPIAVLAVWSVESSSAPFITGRPIIRFENHKFFQFWGVNNEPVFDKHYQFATHAGIPGTSKSKNHKFRKKPTGPWTTFHGDQDKEFEVLAFSEGISSREFACLSTSFGGPQIMGFNHDACGYPTAADLATAFGQQQRWQVLGFFDFCNTNGLISLIRNLNFATFGQKYNGDGAVYGPKLKKAFDQKAKLANLPKIPNPNP